MRRFALTLILLVACGPEVRSGRVVKKWYEPETQTVQMICSVYGKYGCTMWTPIIHHDDEDFMITIKSCEGLRDIPADGCPTSDWKLTPQQWNRLGIGSHYTVEDE